MKRRTSWGRFGIALGIVIAVAITIVVVVRPHETLKGAELSAANTKLQRALSSVDTAASADAQAQTQGDQTNWLAAQERYITSLNTLHDILQTRITQEKHLGTNKAQMKLQLQLDDMKRKIPPSPSSTNQMSNEANLASSVDDGQAVGSKILNL